MSLQKIIWYISRMIFQWEKERYLTQSYAKSPYTNRNFKKKNTTQKRHYKIRVHNDCGPTY